MAGYMNDGEKRKAESGKETRFLTAKDAKYAKGRRGAREKCVKCKSSYESSCGRRQRSDFFATDGHR